MSGAACMRKVIVGNAPAVLWEDSFVEAISTLVTAHSPKIGGSYITNRAMSNNIPVTEAPNARVFAGLIPAGMFLGPLFDVGVPASVVAFDVVSSGIYMLRIPVTNARGPYIECNSVYFNLRSSARIIGGSCPAEYPAAIKITDDGTDALGCIKVFVNGVLRLTAPGGAGYVNTGNTIHSINPQNYGSILSNLRITALE
ncbi:MAG: hypothetical protein U1D97_06680 [Desulfuromonadales bacterium]|nr:hypothetical protein [Desulfuromonadales bacterium]